MTKRTAIIVSVIIMAGVLLYYGITAFIAFRTSNSILEEVKKVNDRLSITNKSFEKNSPELSKDCTDALQRNNLHAISAQYKLTLENLESITDLIKQTNDTLLLISESNQDYDSPSLFMIEDGNGEKLKFKIKNYILSANILRKQLSISEKNVDYLASHEDNGIELSWEMYSFFHLPLVSM